MDLSNYSPGLVLTIVVFLALAPFIAVMVTSFTKLVVVLSLLRNALGLQQVPPNVVINGLAIVLSIYVMHPVILDTHEAVTARLDGRPPPASIQKEIEDRRQAQLARERRAAGAPGADASRPTPPAAADPAPASPAAADALQAEAQAQTTPATDDLFAQVDGASQTTADSGDAPVPAQPAAPAPEIVRAPAAPPPPMPTGPGSDGARLLALLDAGKEPLRTFLIKHSYDAERLFFLRSAQSLLPPERQGSLTVDDFIVIVPAFTVSELTTAFQIGFLIFLPFLVIDLVVANILLALGMMMMSPTIVSLPFKLLLFVLVDGWAKLVHGLVLTYAV